MQIETDLGMTFTGLQVREKFKRMIKDCNISKILVNKNNKIYINYIYKKYISILIILIFLVI